MNFIPGLTPKLIFDPYAIKPLSNHTQLLFTNLYFLNIYSVLIKGRGCPWSWGAHMSGNNKRRDITI